MQLAGSFSALASCMGPSAAKGAGLRMTKLTGGVKLTTAQDSEPSGNSELGRALLTK
jgi:hypothetical protein